MRKLVTALDIVVIAIVLGSCDAINAGFLPYEKKPSVMNVLVTVVPSTNDEIRERCGAGAFECATVATPTFPYSTMWIDMPQSFSDTTRVCNLGHEFLHSLGATHRDQSKGG